ncbi:major histocompatibility complex class I-related gene protein-like [Alligator sinensis]|uniref:Major histocompatibility complex class I-related gene protein-like n=2 Tax=Alligator sinensis TaxID=38654 RepID=A0A1U8DDT6_ALLSI|nr:major histocompatibility complex class I-related gene protein-like [Alligator sinensis]
MLVAPNFLGLKHSGATTALMGGSVQTLCTEQAPAQRCPSPDHMDRHPAPPHSQLLVGMKRGPAACDREGSHSYQHFYMGVSDPGPGMPDFTARGYVDDQQILHYDNKTRRQEPRGDWVQRAVRPDFWDRETRSLRGWQRVFQSNLVTLRYRYNQTGGSHTLQFMYGCELREHNSTGGHMLFGYDGEDFISYDLRTHTWVAAPTQAESTQSRWNKDKALLQDARSYLEETCIKWLRQYLQHGEAALQSKHPMAQVSGRPSRDGRTTLSCHVHGFYPRDVAVAWLKNGTNRSGVLPSGDGTYQTWATIEIDPSSNHSYTCSVQHESLGAALSVAWDKGSLESNWVLIMGIIFGVLLVIAMMSAVANFFCLREPAPPPETPMEQERK